MPILAQVEFTASTGMPADNFINTFAFITPAGFNPALGAIQAGLDSFYNGQNGANPKVAGYISDSASRAAGGITYRLYDIAGALGGGPTGSPVATSTGTLAAGLGQIPMPDEVAMCLTLRGSDALTSPVEAPDGSDPGIAPDRPRSRKTGRVYIGPLTQGAATSGPPPRPATNFQTVLLDAGERMFDLLFPQSILWSVWSRTDATLRSLTSISVDDAFDTQRRRGPAATSRVSRVL
jgi:hypothetical protein